MSKTVESNGRPCRHTSMGKVCRHRRAYTYETLVDFVKVEVATGLFICHNPKSDHYGHTFTKIHRMCHWWE